MTAEELGTALRIAKQPDEVAALLVAGAQPGCKLSLMVNGDFRDGCDPADEENKVRILRILLEAGASCEREDQRMPGVNEIHSAGCYANDACMQLLLRHAPEHLLNAPIQSVPQQSYLLVGETPLGSACRAAAERPLNSAVCGLEKVQLLCLFGASRDEVAAGLSAEAMVLSQPDCPQRAQLLVWLRESRDWRAPLDYLQLLTPARTRTLLRGGADLPEHDPALNATPLELGLTHRSLHALARGGPSASELPPAASSEALMMLAAAPWCPENHHLFPPRARARAVDVLFLLNLLRLQPGAHPVWAMLLCPHHTRVHIILPLVISRSM